jgi:hypothetical protein
MRQSRARVTDVRVWGGLILLVVAAVLGAVLLGRGSETVLVLQAGRDLSVGSVPLDVVPVAVPADLAAAYLPAGEPVDGRLRWPVAVGELIPRSAVTVPVMESTRSVTVSVESGHAPAGLMPGDLVDVWATRADAGGFAAPATDPSLVLADASVVAVAADAAGFGGGFAVELAVPTDRVGELVSAARGGVLDLVAVPLESQQAIP